LIYSLSPNQNGGVGIQLALVLEALRDFNTSEMRDRVYAAVCLTDQDSLNHSLLRPNYSRSIRDVFTDATEYVIRHPDPESRGSRPLDILSSVTEKRNVPDDFPSWVPRWDEKPNTKDLWITNISSLWDASLGRTSMNIRVTDRKGLVLEGIKLGAVSFVDHSLSRPWESEENKVKQLWDSTVSGSQGYGSQMDLAEAFAQTVTAGKSRDPLDTGAGEGEPFHAQDLAIHIGFPTSQAERDRMGIPIGLQMKMFQETAHFQKSIRDGDAFFLLSEGSIGIGHSDIREGDEVWILFGGRLPYVIRKFGDHYQFLRKCYVAGAMDGAVVSAWESGKVFAKEEVEIC
jgi:hypothetical protein